MKIKPCICDRAPYQILTKVAELIKKFNLHGGILVVPRQSIEHAKDFLVLAKEFSSRDHEGYGTDKHRS